VRSRVTVVTRLRLAARLFTPPPPRPAPQKGRPRLVGARLANLACHVADPQAVWTPLAVSHCYGEQDRPGASLTQTAICSSTGCPPVPIRGVLIRDPRGTLPTHALLCTDRAAAPLQILTGVVRRWQLEVTFHEVRTHLGVATRAPGGGPRDPADHARAAGSLLPRDLTGTSGAHGTDQCIPRALSARRVRQDDSHRRRRPGAGPS
jgi:hypothetical protein